MCLVAYVGLVGFFFRLASQPTDAAYFGMVGVITTLVFGTWGYGRMVKRTARLITEDFGNQRSKTEHRKKEVSSEDQESHNFTGSHPSNL
jgi:hypothetical protein